MRLVASVVVQSQLRSVNFYSIFISFYLRFKCVCLKNIINQCSFISALFLMCVLFKWFRYRIMSLLHPSLLLRNSLMSLKYVTHFSLFKILDQSGSDVEKALVKQVHVQKDTLNLPLLSSRIWNNVFVWKAMSHRVCCVCILIKNIFLCFLF